MVAGKETDVLFNKLKKDPEAMIRMGMVGDLLANLHDCFIHNAKQVSSLVMVGVIAEGQGASLEAVKAKLVEFRDKIAAQESQILAEVLGIAAVSMVANSLATEAEGEAVMEAATDMDGAAVRDSGTTTIEMVLDYYKEIMEVLAPLGRKFLDETLARVATVKKQGTPAVGNAPAVVEPTEEDVALLEALLGEPMEHDETPLHVEETEALDRQNAYDSWIAESMSDMEAERERGNEEG